MGRCRRSLDGSRVALGFLLAIGARAFADETPAPTEVQQLAAEVAQLRAEVAELRRTNSPSPLSLRLSGFVQADAVAYRQDSEDQLNFSTGKPENETRFLIRRAHLRADAEVWIFSGALEVEASTVQNPGVRLFDAEASVRWPSPHADAPPYVMATVGMIRIPFGFENQEKDYVRLFLERSALVRALFPGENDLGVRLQGGWNFLRYQLAVMNGHPSAEAQFPTLDPTASKDFLGRIGMDARLRPRLSIQAGVSALYGTGFHAGTPSTKNVLTWHDDNGDGLVQLSELQAILGRAATPSENFHRSAVGGDLRLVIDVPRLGELHLYGEITWATNLDRAMVVADPVAVGRDLRELGWYVAFTQEIGRYAAVGLRYDRYNPDEDAIVQIGAARVPKDSTFSTLAVAAAVQFPPYARVTVEYDHNGNALGIAAGGAPTTLGSDALTFRAQVVF
jgi:hypothetical protein